MKFDVRCSLPAWWRRRRAQSLAVFAALGILVPSAGAMEIGVRIRFGLTDRQPTRWDGTVAVEPGRVTSISGWRFADGDAAKGTEGWSASTRRAPQQQRARTNNPRRAAKPGANPAGPMTDNGVILNLADVTEDSTVSVTTPKGKFRFQLREIPYAKVLDELDGAVDIERCAAAAPLTTQRTDDDFPAATLGADGTLFVAYVSFTPGLDRDERARQWTNPPADLSFLAKPAGGDQIWLRSRKEGRWGEPLPVTPGQGDIYKCAVAVDGHGRLWVIWSERKDGHFDIWTRSVEGARLSSPQRLSNASGNDHSPVAATDADGRVWVAWQGARGNVFRILSRRQKDGSGWTDEMVVSSQKRNCWAPAITTDARSGGKVAIAWDTYDKGDYDVWLREFDSKGRASAPRVVANSPRYEARPSLAYDQEGRLWIAWEESGQTWGKDWGALEQTGIPLYADRQIGLRVLSQSGDWLETANTFTNSLPGVRLRRAVRPQRVPALEPESETRRQAQEAETRARVPYNNISRVVADRAGRIWLLARTRQSDFRAPIGSVWLEYASYYDGDRWVGPILIPHSDNLLYNVPAVVPSPEGGLLVAHSSDHRQDRHIVRRGQGGNAALAADRDPFDNDIYISRLPMSEEPGKLSFKAAAQAPEARRVPSPATVKELEDIARCRAQRITVAGKRLRLLRGEFHRHTEISGDGGNDGPLEDMWRYAIDVASMDWIGCGDHDNGNGREYTWWLTQKTTDAFQLPRSFDPLFTYERSVRYPEGHRNVVFPTRGIRTLPRLPIQREQDPGPAPDTQLLYKYLRRFGGLCASHTSATDMGTDWRDNDPEVEPFVEIYQGCRQNYERPDAPRCPTENDSIGGWRPKGFVNHALLKGYRLAFQSSSDHRSTHISYCLVYAEDATREAIVQAMKARHTYAATDNIIADYRCTANGQEHMMGDEFSAAEPPTLRLKLHGTAPFAKIVIVKNDEYVHTATPNTAKVELTWTDPNPTPGQTSYYYVRGEQTDGELVWASPMWIAYRPK
ncbi:MAG: hypothetical protein HYY23_12015 [Verrucomicrobia bacterium]|nr:hypothetical protein [Verrucomicrobiota bacterium]